MVVKHDSIVPPWMWRAGNCLLLSVSLAVIADLVIADLEVADEEQYTWRTGQWGQCVGEDCGPGGVQTRMVWCTHVDGWTAEPSSCAVVEKPDHQRPCFRVCERHQELFEWEASGWGPCVTPEVESGQRVECVTAQHGVQRRVVRCVRSANRSTVTARVCLFFAPPPPDEQACLTPCPHPCVVSHFSPWSDCSTTCGTGLQHRTRAVLAAPVYGGSDCPPLTQTRTCQTRLPCPAGENEHSYSLKVGAWSECRLPHHRELRLSGRTMLDFSSEPKVRSTIKRHVHQHPHVSRSWEVELGYQTRQVRCMRSDGKNAMLSLCTQENAPVTFQSCVMPRDCETSHWSPWSPCSKSCRGSDLSPGFRTRSQSLKQLPVGGGKECPALEEKEACNIIGDLLPNCPRYVWKSTEWGDCQVQPLLSQQDRRHGNLSTLCGGGFQSRETYCTLIPGESKEVSRPVSGRLCLSPPPAAVQPCSIPCPQECLLSHWSSWGPCLHEICLEPQGRKGFRQRRRQVVREPAGTPQGCLHLDESMPCEDPVCFLWRALPEGDCLPTHGICGPGSREQRVRCVDTQGQSVPDERCLEEPPPSMLSCDVPCPGDCVLSPWSAWSPCSHSCSGKNAEGRQSRVRAVLAVPGEGGKPCPLALALEEWRLCNTNPCIVFYWEAGPWGPCTEEPGVGGPNGTGCAVGVQSRHVACMKMSVGQVIPKRCPDSLRLETTRPCLLPCRKDCVVTPFTEWTACPSSCRRDNGTAASQSRYRIIVQRPASGGLECPDTLHEERECDPPPACPAYRWTTHRWQPCTLVPDSVRQGLAVTGESCGPGLETRDVTCMDEDEKSAEVTECLLWAGAMPSRVRECRIPCRDDCTLSSWSRFTECSGCGSWKSRKRALTGRSKKQPRCLRSELYPLVEMEPCPCPELQAQPVGNWSACILPESHGWRSQREVRECGQGLKYRTVACTDQEDRLVDPALCGGSGYVEEVCHIPCPLDCKLSEWSAWTACSAPCGSGVKVRSKWLREKPFNGGRPCPKLDLKNQVYEAVPCYSECTQFSWSTEPWSVCTINSVDKPPGCGEGVQSRKVKCVRQDSSGDSVDDSLCDLEEMPARAQTCFLPCAEDCVMSDWSQWSVCATPCDPSSERTRHRRMLRLPQEGRVCPEANQTESCVLNSTCFTYHYNLSDWSTCLLSESALCGQGLKIRQLDCVRSDGRMVELSVCGVMGLLNQWRLTTPCVVDCPVNCLLSEWTLWSECSLTCGRQGHMSRSRSILQDAHEQGRPCPAQLSQTKPCPIQPCYTWVLGNWSPCRVEGATCGEGVRERNLTCVVHGAGQLDVSSAKSIDSEKCDHRMRRAGGLELKLPCSVPCPGDCHLTEWSSWSSCQLTCLEGRSFETMGMQARSRAVVVQVLENQESCPQQVFETRSCKGGKCHSYEWKVSAWRDNERTVWCERSDGVNVTGGCYECVYHCAGVGRRHRVLCQMLKCGCIQQNRPSAVRHCHPPCTKPFSYCTQNGVCGCEKGYTEVMTSHGFLDYCTRTPGADNKKADVKTSSGRLRPGTSQVQDFFHTWSLKPVGPDGRVRLWVYGVTGGGFALILLVIVLTFLMCDKPLQSKNASPPQKTLALAYDGDMDM